MTERIFDTSGAEIMTSAECLRLLASQPLGRLVFHQGGLPAVRLVNFAIDDDAVVFRTAGGQSYAAARRGEVVAFEVDDYDVDRHLGWTVTVTGHVWPVTDEVEIERIGRLPLRPWAHGDRRHLLRLDIEALEGRRLVPWGLRPAQRS